MSLIHPPTEAIDQRVVGEPPPMWMRGACLCVYCVAKAILTLILWTLMVGVMIYKGIVTTVKWLKEGK